MVNESQTEDVLRFAGEARRIQSGIESPTASLDAKSALLNQLADEGKASVVEDDIVLSPASAVRLTAGEQRLLALPEVYPFGLELSISGILTDSDHHYHYHFIDGSRQAFTNVDRRGPILTCDGMGPYLLDEQLYELIEEIEWHRDGPQEGMRESFLLFAKIKGLAVDTGVLLDGYLEEESVVTSDSLTIRLSRGEDGSLGVEPVISAGEGDIEGTDIAQSEFLRRFDSLGAKAVYPLTGKRVVVTEAQEEGLRQIKEVRHVPKEDEESFLRTPQAYLDPDLIDLDSFSDRVIEIGEHQYKAFPFLRESKEPWLPPEGGLIIDGEVLPIPVDEARGLLEAITGALDQGEKSIEWNGRQIPVGPEVVGALEDLIGQLPKEEGRKGEDRPEGGEEKPDTRVLRIVDNFEADEYSSVRVERDPKSIHALPRSLQADTRLFPHQKEGLAWLQTRWHRGARGAIVADDMGLGKTLLALSFAAWCAELMEEGLYPRRPVLIVAPVSLLENWQTEYEKRLTPIFGSPHVLYGRQIRELMLDDGRLDVERITDTGLVFTTYETLRRHQLSLGVIDWAVAILDEAQKVKTPTAMVTTAVKAMKYDFGIAMTGTPVENSWVDLWSLMDFAQPGHLESLKGFVAKYQTPLGRPETDRHSLGANLQGKVEQYMLRRMKEDHIEGLPTKTVIAHRREMPPIQLRSYVNAVTRAKTELGGEGSGGTNVLKMIAHLRDVSLCPLLGIRDDLGLADTSTDELVSSSARLQATFEILDERQSKSEKAIVFLVSKRLQRVVQRVIRERYQVHAHIINGDVSGPKRQQLVDAFQEAPGFGVIILSTEAAGVGLNITAANHVVHLSRVWNPAKEDQATDRVYRIGQTKPVQVHIPMAVSPKLSENGWTPFDERLDSILEEKRALSRSVLLPSVIEEGEFAAFAQDLLSGDAIISDEPNSAVVGPANTDWVDRLSPEAFEDLSALLYRRMGYQVTRTPRSRDHGADVVAVPHEESGSGFVVQCKHTIHPRQPVASAAVDEVLSALTYYTREYSTNFLPVVVTNAVSLGERGTQLATQRDVQVVTRDELGSLLIEHEISESELRGDEAVEVNPIETEVAG
jgi:hypothetical protein